MIQVQDDNQIPKKTDLNVSAGGAANTNSVSDQNKIDDLLKQLEDLSQEIEKKSASSVVRAPSESAKLEEPAPTPAIEAAPKPVQIAEPSEKTALPSSVSSKAESNDEELDTLIAELEESLKNLVARKEASKTVSTTPSPMFKPEEKVEPLKKEEKEDFDLDAFIKDLEKKIEQEEKKDYSSEQVDSVKPTPSVADFRKNRLTPDIEEPDVEVAEPVEPTVSTKEPVKTADPESLEAQNIFDMLNITEASDQEKDQFLSDLENLIWDNFVETDLPLLLTSSEYGEAKEILSQQTKSEMDKKEALLVYLEKLIPDLEEIMYEKALDLKKDLMAERVNKLKADASKSEALAAVEKLMAEDKWQSATTALNKI